MKAEDGDDQEKWELLFLFNFLTLAHCVCSSTILLCLHGFNEE